MFLSVPEWEIFLKAILGRFPRPEMKDQRRSFLFITPPIRHYASFEEVDSCKKRRSLPSCPELFSQLKKHASKSQSTSEAIVILHFCKQSFSDRTSVHPHRCCLAAVQSWINAGGDDVNLDDNDEDGDGEDDHDGSKIMMTLIFMIKGEIKSSCPEWKVKQKSTITCWQIRHLGFPLTL